LADSGKYIVGMTEIQAAAFSPTGFCGCRQKDKRMMQNQIRQGRYQAESVANHRSRSGGSKTSNEMNTTTTVISVGRISGVKSEISVTPVTENLARVLLIVA
jgi:hypothetical protein